MMLLIPKKISGDIPNIIVASGRSDFHANVVAKDFYENFEYFKPEAGSVFDASSPFVCAEIGSIVEKLINEVSTGTLH